MNENMSNEIVNSIIKKHYYTTTNGNIIVNQNIFQETDFKMINKLISEISPLDNLLEYPNEVQILLNVATDLKYIDIVSLIQKNTVQYLIIYLDKVWLFYNSSIHTSSIFRDVTYEFNTAIKVNNTNLRRLYDFESVHTDLFSNACRDIISGSINFAWIPLLNTLLSMELISKSIIKSIFYEIKNEFHYINLINFLSVLLYDKQDTPLLENVEELYDKSILWSFQTYDTHFFDVKPYMLECYDNVLDYEIFKKVFHSKKGLLNNKFLYEMIVDDLFENRFAKFKVRKFEYLYKLEDINADKYWSNYNYR